MTSSSVTQGVHIPVRSISLPTRLHPNSLRIEAELMKLKSLELSSASSIQVGLTRLAELYNCIEEVMQSPLTQQTLHHQQHVKLVEEALDGSIALLDLCGNARDLILTMMEQMQDLQSALRRRGKDSSIESNIHAFISFRKKSKKDIAMCLKALKKMESNTATISLLNVDHHVLMVVKVQRESSGIMISIFRSLLLFFCMPVTKTNACKWSLLSKLIPVASERGQKIVNEVGSIDIALYSFHGQIRKNDAKIDVQLVQRSLETLDCSIKGFEARLDCLFRRLIQNRVSLLNILTP